MLVVLSPAKKLDFTSPVATSHHTRPALASHVEELAGVARRLSRKALQGAMDLSDGLADLTWSRFQELEPAPEPPAARQAMLAFAGDVYQGLEARTLSEKDLLWAQDHVAILSGLYGVLRPLDLVQPYRLEMGAKVKTKRGRDLYAFWCDAVADQLKSLVKGHADPTIVNLASDEYFSAVDRERLGLRVVMPVFQDVRDGKARSLFLFVKRARGRMARWVVDHRAGRASALRDAVVDGYRLDRDASDDDRWVFRRPHPASM
jgi:cytoplasmic iron level regulating protein YaaA (DUF328/UPF0246 family)